MAAKQLFKKVLIPCAAGVGLTADGHNLGPNCAKRPETRPSELPIYSAECTVCGAVSQKPPQPPSQLEEAIGNVRKELWVWQDNLKGYRHKFVDVYQSNLSKIQFPIEYLREETHGPQRAGAIALSGLTGFIFALRKGFFGKFFYTSLGALGMAAICYPNEAVVYTDEALQEGKRYFIIAYHFIYGEPPKMPTWPEWLKLKTPEEYKKAVEDKLNESAVLLSKHNSQQLQNHEKSKLALLTEPKYLNKA